MHPAFVNSLPKAGTNMVAKCLTLFGYRQIGHVGRERIFGRGIHAVVNRLMHSRRTGGYDIGLRTQSRVSASLVERNFVTTDRNVFLTAHVAFSPEFLACVQRFAFQPILITRDPRAVLASHVPYVMARKAHFLNKQFAGLSEHERYMVSLRGGGNGRSSFKSLPESCQLIEGWRTSEAVLHVRFEDLVGAKGGGSDAAQLENVGRIARWLGLDETKVPEVAANLFGAGRSTFRKGQVDSWRSELPADILAAADRELADILHQWGYR